MRRVSQCSVGKESKQQCFRVPRGCRTTSLFVLSCIPGATHKRSSRICCLPSSLAAQCPSDGIACESCLRQPRRETSIPLSGCWGPGRRAVAGGCPWGALRASAEGSESLGSLTQLRLAWCGTQGFSAVLRVSFLSYALCAAYSPLHSKGLV